MRTMLLMLIACMSFVCGGCTKDNSDEVPKGYEIINGVLYPLTPDWVYAKIDTIKNHPELRGSKIDLYHWAGAFYYVVNIPSEKMRGRFLYRVDGTKVVIEGEVLRDFYFKRDFRLNIWSDIYSTTTPNEVSATFLQGYTLTQIINFIREQPVENTGFTAFFDTRSPDSIASIQAALKEKAYVLSFSMINQADTLFRFTASMKGVAIPVNTTDLTGFTDRFKLSFSSSGATSHFSVPAGTELEWTKRLYSYECVWRTE